MPAQNSLTSFNSVNQPTMSSLEMVEFINSSRPHGEPELLHKNFLAKVPEVLGERSAEFLADLPDAYGRPRRAYRFPKREACLMAMSYSYELQAKVFDRMTELEISAQPQRLPGRTTLKQIMGFATLSSREIALMLGISHEIICNRIRYLTREGTIKGPAADEKVQLHPDNGITYREFVLGVHDSVEVAAGFGRRARSIVLDYWMGLDLDVDAAVEQAAVQRLTYEYRPLALPDAKELEQDARRVLVGSYKLWRSLGHTPQKARAIAVKDTRMTHGVDYSSLLDETT